MARAPVASAGVVFGAIGMTGIGHLCVSDDRDQHAGVNTKILSLICRHPRVTGGGGWRASCRANKVGTYCVGMQPDKVCVLAEWLGLRCHTTHTKDLLGYWEAMAQWQGTALVRGSSLIFRNKKCRHVSASFGQRGERLGALNSSTGHQHAWHHESCAPHH